MDIDLSYLHYPESVPTAVRRAFAAAEVLFDATAVDRAVDRLAVRMTVTWQNEDPLLVVLLPEGLVLAGMLMRRLVFPCQQVTTTLDGQGVPVLDNDVLIRRRNVVFIGASLGAPQLEVLQRWAQAHEAGTVSAVVLVAAPGEHGGCGLDIIPALESPERALLGTGFDLQGYGANLPGLYRVPG